jgi:tetratricopeptide (TPR) repeat protein
MAWSAVLLSVIALAYANSFSGAFVLDDLFSIVENPSIRDLGKWQAVLWPPSSAPTSGRPLLNLSFALNYALGGTAVAGYHVANLLIHLGAALVLFLLVRRTLLLPVFRGRFDNCGDLLATFVAILWSLHPLQTASVTYVSQRAESLMGLCYLVTLYCFVRATSERARPIWYAASITVCAMGMAAKEVMVTAPVAVLLYDRTFLAGSFRRAWLNRPRYYVGLMATWLLMAVFMIVSRVSHRGIADGATFTWWSYALTECRVVLGYLKLAIWPHPLIFDYEIDRDALPHVDNASRFIGPAAAIIAMLSCTIALLRYRPVLGFLAAWFFMLLAPTSTVVPITFQPMAENRMYLSLMAVSAAFVFAMETIISRRFYASAMAAGAAFLLLTHDRNKDYSSELSLWSDTVAKRPQNARAHNNYGLALAQHPRRIEEELAEYRAAIRLRPDYAAAYNNLGLALLRIPDRWPEAAECYQKAIQLMPACADFHSNLGNLFTLLPGRLEDAIRHHREAVSLAPNLAMAHFNLALALSKVPDVPGAIAHYERALEINPNYVEAHNALGILLMTSRKGGAEAAHHFRAAVHLRPDAGSLHYNLAVSLTGDRSTLSDALFHYEEALRINPLHLDARLRYASALASIPGGFVKAEEQFQAALKTSPQDPRVHFSFAAALAQVGDRNGEAIAHLEIAIRLAPEWNDPRLLLARLR